jgi:hypothetical protein
VLPGNFAQHLLGPIGLADTIESIEHGRILTGRGLRAGDWPGRRRRRARPPNLVYEGTT